MRNSPALLSLLGALGLLTPAVGCSMTRMAASSTVDVMYQAAPSLAEERDPVLADAALLANLKLFEGLLRVEPDNERLLRLTTEAFSSYAYGFLEPRAWRYDDPDDPALQILRARIKDYYQRAVAYADRLVALRLPDVAPRLAKGGPALDRALADDFDADELDALFWAGHTRGLLINSDPDDLAAVAGLRTVQQLMARVGKSRPAHEDGMPSIFAGMSNAVLGAGLGGDMDASRSAFQTAIAATEGAYLLPRFLYGRYYCTATLDRACFEQALTEVVEADPDALPRRRLTNVLAQQWAAYWLTRADELF